MTNPVAVVREVGWTPPSATESRTAWREVRVWCPGCNSMHPFRTWVDPEYPARQDGSPYPTWGWNGSLTSPTFEPSLLCYSAVHLCAGEHDLLALECADEEFEACGHLGHGVAWQLTDGSVAQLKTWETVPADARRFTFGGPSTHPRDPAWGNCHSFLRNGVWEFLGDSGHQLRGMHPLQPLPDWVVGDD